MDLSQVPKETTSLFIMKAHLLSLLASLALAKAVPMEMELQITVNDGGHEAIHPLATIQGINGVEFVTDCTLRENWHKACRLTYGRDDRWRGECEVSAGLSL